MQWPSYGIWRLICVASYSYSFSTIVWVVYFYFVCWAKQLTTIQCGTVPRTSIAACEVSIVHRYIAMYYLGSAILYSWQKIAVHRKHHVVGKCCEHQLTWIDLKGLEPVFWDCQPLHGVWQKGAHWYITATLAVLDTRCFEEVNKKSLPVRYYSQSKAWMTADISNDIIGAWN